MVDLFLFIQIKKHENPSRFFFLHYKVQSAKFHLIVISGHHEQGCIGKCVFPARWPLLSSPKYPSELLFTLLYFILHAVLVLQLHAVLVLDLQLQIERQGKCPSAASPLLALDTVVFFAAFPKPAQNSINSPFIILSSNYPIWKCLSAKKTDILTHI